ncbi:unnamed protein product [Boreogadus saida]
MNPLRTLVATQLPSEGSVVPDDSITRHIVLKVFRGPAQPNPGSRQGQASRQGNHEEFRLPHQQQPGREGA